MSAIIHISSNMNSGKLHLPNYQEYKNDILQFNTEIYLKNKMETNNIVTLTEFLDIYKVIEEEDLKKPIFSQTTKFKKFPNHLKYYKYIKFSRDEESRKRWSVQRPVDEVDKMVLFIKSTLNKMAEDNFESVCDEFMQELIGYDHPDLFEILSNEIYIKCIQDSKYRRFYIQLCNPIWMNKDIHAQRMEIIDLEGDFYVQFKYVEKEFGLDNLNEEKLMGPYTTAEEAYHEAYKAMNFKRYFINFLENKFQERDIEFVKENVSNQVFFDKKNAIMGLMDILFILFQEKYIHMDILHIMILHFLHVNNMNFEPIYEIEMECVHFLIKNLYENAHIQKAKYLIFDNYLSFFETYKQNQTMSKRMEFFITDMERMIQSPLLTSNKVVSKQMTEKEFMQCWKKHMKEENRNGFLDCVHKYLTEENKQSVLESILFFIYDQKDTKTIYFEMLESVGQFDTLQKIITKIIDKLEDYSMDISNLPKKLLKTIDVMKRFELTENWKEQIYQFIQQNKDDDSDDAEEEEEEWERLV